MLILFQPSHIKKFYFISSNNVKNSRHLANYHLNLAAIFLVYIWLVGRLVGWLNSGAPTLVILQHLLKVRIFYETSWVHGSDCQKLKK